MSETSFALCVVGIALIVVAAQQAQKYFGALDDPSQPRRRARITNDMIDVVQAIVPWIPRADIERDLQETHSIEETTMRFVNSNSAQGDNQPTHQPAHSTNGPGAGSAPSSIGKNASLSPEASLLRKFGITVTDTDQAGDAASQGWSADRESREDRLNNRRREMVLRAREKMLAKKAAKAAQ